MDVSYGNPMTDSIVKQEIARERERCAAIVRKHIEFWKKIRSTDAGSVGKDKLALECENILTEITQGK